MKEYRLDKILADSGLTTRKEARMLIKSGRVSINGEIAKKPELKANPDIDEVRLDDRPVGNKTVYIMLNKPDGVVSATEDSEHKTVLDLLPKEIRRKGVYPVGRLDKDTTGLMILTNDGKFCHNIISPKSNVDKVYEAYVEGSIDDGDIAAFRDGLELRDGSICLPATLFVDKNDKSHAEITISEGKYHQVKRMFASRGKRVTFLKRISIGNLKLDESLEPGKFREISSQELKLIFATSNKLVTKRYQL